MQTTKTILRLLLTIMFVASGIAHLVWPSVYARIVPPMLPVPKVLVLISGVAEIVGGVGLLITPLHRAAAYGLIALLVAVFPANLYMAVAPEKFADLHVSDAILWARLPLQAVMIAAVWWSTVVRP